MSQTDYPKVEQVRGGWAALGAGWAVHGETEQEARRRYEEAERRHREIDVRAAPSNSAEPGAAGNETPG